MQMDDKPLDEAALIEERRKRREAIRAKYKRQDTPLLVQALSLKNEVVPDPSETDVHAIATPSESQLPIGVLYPYLTSSSITKIVSTSNTEPCIWPRVSD